MADYLTRLENLLTGAQTSVEIVCPFVDDIGATILGGAYDRSTRLASWRVFVRTAPPRLIEIARTRGWQLYEYIGTPGGEERRGFHCKIFIADDRRAILGSANLIYHNLVENVEIGIALDDEREVAPLLQVPRALMRASRRVP